jgi:hypothetical protein
MGWLRQPSRQSKQLGQAVGGSPGCTSHDVFNKYIYGDTMNHKWNMTYINIDK